MNNLESRIEALESVEHDKNSALPLINYRWTGPEFKELTFMIHGGEVIERLPDENDEAYKKRALYVCQTTHKGRTMPMLQTNEGFISKSKKR